MPGFRSSRIHILTSDYNAEMIEHIERFPRVRDQALFVGNRDDVVQESFGADLPMIDDWTEDHFDFTDYITGFDPAAFADRTRLRAELGYGDDERVCLVTVGGSGVGAHLLRRVVDAFPEARERVPELRMIVVCGPRIDPESLPAAPGSEVVTYVHDLYRHLAACDLAVIQGGLTASMELTAARRPFLYFPFRHHFEQNFHVRHLLDRYVAGRCMDFDESTPELITAAIAEEIGSEADDRPVETDGAARAAARMPSCSEPARRAGFPSSAGHRVVATFPHVGELVQEILTGGGLLVLFSLVVAENLFPPIPSEVILPLAGFLVSEGEMSFAGALLASGLGSLAGAIILYVLGRYGGRPLLLRHGRLLRLSEERLDRADAWFDRHGRKIVFFGRMVPGVRSVVSIPAGISEMPPATFAALTLAGATLWNGALIGAAWALGDNWGEVTAATESLSGVLIAAAALGLAALVLAGRRWHAR